LKKSAAVKVGPSKIIEGGIKQNQPDWEAKAWLWVPWDRKLFYL